MKWIDPPENIVSQELFSGVGGNPLVSKILSRRGIVDFPTARAFLDPHYYTPTPSKDLPGLEIAIGFIEYSIKQHERICVWGDFDVDGQTATTVLVSALRDLGGDVIFHIPNRETESHGIQLIQLKQEIKKGINLLITCDTGITAHDAVNYARQAGIKVVITDHHDLPEILPQAHAIINPKMLLSGHLLATLPGVGVAFKLVEALFIQLKPNETMDNLLDLVALGIVADVAIQTGDTRFLLQRGIATLRDCKRIGIQALCDLAGLTPENLTEEHIGFALAPRLNALGRLSDTNDIVEFLTTNNPSFARAIAINLEGLNNKRKLLTEQVYRGAMAQIERDPSVLNHAALVLAHPLWHGGVLGPVASRLVEIYAKPVILLRTPPGEFAQGSARSVDGCDISAILRVNKRYLHSFGGHPMAAGMSLSVDNIPSFRNAISRTIHEMEGTDDVEPKLHIDSYVNLSDLTDAFIKDIERLAPFGPGNPQLVYATRNLTVSSKRIVGQGDNHLLLVVNDEKGDQHKVMWWRGAGLVFPENRFDLAFHAHSTTYQGKSEISLVWVDAHTVENVSMDLNLHNIEVIDHRQEDHPMAILKQLILSQDIQIWCEGEAKRLLDGKDRTELLPANELIIWTTPPGGDELKKVLKQVSPRKIYLFSVHPQKQDLETFLLVLVGLVKHTLNNKGGKTNINELAAATAQRQAAIGFGLSWLEKKGMVHFHVLDDGIVILDKESDGINADMHEMTGQVKAVLDETAAYRDYFKRASTSALF